MKAIKKILIALAVLVIVYVVVAFFAPSSYMVKRTKIINAPTSIVWEQVSKFENWGRWSPWAEKDSASNYTLNGVDATVGTAFNWVGDPEISGEGSMTINEIAVNEKFGYDLTFTKPRSMSSKGGFTLSSQGETTELVWFDGSEIALMSRPIMLFMNIDEMIGPDFDRGLVKIDSISSAISVFKKANNIIEKTFPGGLYVGKRHMIKIAEMDSAIYAESLIGLGEFCGTEGLSIVGAPCSIIHKWNEPVDYCDFTVAFKIDDKSVHVPTPDFEYVELPESRSIIFDFYGPYENTGEGHLIIHKYLKLRKITHFKVVEAYLNDPTTVNSPDEILTRIYYLIED